MLKFIFFTVVLLVFIDLHSIEGEPLADPSAVAEPSNKMSSYDSDSNCKSGKCKRSSKHKSSGRKGKRKCRGSKCCMGNSCYPMYPQPPYIPPTMAPTMSPTMAQTMPPMNQTTSPQECPSKSQLIRVMGAASIPTALSGLGFTFGDIVLNITNPARDIIGMCLPGGLCPVGTALVNLKPVPESSLIDTLARLQIGVPILIPIITKNLTNADGLIIAVCPSLGICPPNSILINIDTVSVETVAILLADLGIDGAAIVKTIFDAYGIPAGICIGGGSACPENTLFLNSGSIPQDTIQNAMVSVFGTNAVATISANVSDPITGSPVGVCLSPTPTATTPLTTVISAISVILGI